MYAIYFGFGFGHILLVSSCVCTSYNRTSHPDKPLRSEAAPPGLDFPPHLHIGLAIRSVQQAKFKFSNDKTRVGPQAYIQYSI